VERVSLSVGSIAPVAYLRINEAILGNENQTSLPPKLPPLLDSPWEGVEINVDAVNADSAFTKMPTMSLAYTTQELSPDIVVSTPGRRGIWVSVSNVFVPQASEASIKSECKECWEKVRSECSFDANSALC
jgi:hypothetical protein